MDRVTLQVEHAGRTLLLEVGVSVLEISEPETAPVSSMAPAPWTAKGFSWSDAFSLSHPALGVVAIVFGQTVTIWSDDRSKFFEFTAPEGSDPRLFVWNKLCELSLHTCTPEDAMPEVSL
jgi:hypothetical protein